MYYLHAYVICLLCWGLLILGSLLVSFGAGIRVVHYQSRFHLIVQKVKYVRIQYFIHRRLKISTLSLRYAFTLNLIYNTVFLTLGHGCILCPMLSKDHFSFFCDGKRKRSKDLPADICINSFLNYNIQILSSLPFVHYGSTIWELLYIVTLI